MPRGFGTDISLLGDKELEKKLHRLQYKEQRRIVGQAMTDAARLVADRANQLAPIDVTEHTQSGKQVGKHLKGGIKVKAPTRKQLASGRNIAAYVRTPTRTQLGIPKSAKYYYPSALEFGYTRRASGVWGSLGFGTNVPAQPYLRPALYDQLDRLRRIIREEVWREVKRSTVFKGRRGR